MHQAGRADHLAAERLADGLMAETNAQQRNSAGVFLDQFEADAGSVRIARPRRKDDAARIQRQRIVGAERIITINLHLGPEFAQIVHEVVGEAVVIVD